MDMIKQFMLLSVCVLFSSMTLFFSVKAALCEVRELGCVFLAGVRVVSSKDIMELNTADHR